MILFNRMVDQGNTLYLIEHSLDVMKDSDYIVELGPGGGMDGGDLLFAGGRRLFVAGRPLVLSGGIHRLAQGILQLGQHIFQRMVVLFLIRHIYSRTAYRCLHWQML